MRTKKAEANPWIITKAVRSLPLKYPRKQKDRGIIRYSKPLPRIYWAVAWMTAGSPSNKEARKSPAKKVSEKVRMPQAKLMAWATYMARKARCGFPAPIFCATKADRADINAEGAMERNTNSFSEMPMPAEATNPSPFTMLVIIKKEI